MQVELVRQQNSLNRVQKYTWHLRDGILQRNISCVSGAGTSEERGKCFQEGGHMSCIGRFRYSQAIKRCRITYSTVKFSNFSPKAGIIGL